LGTRVLHVITRLTRGGAERRVHDVIRAVDADHVVAMGPDSNPVAIEELLANPYVEPRHVVRCPDLWREVQPRADALAYRQLLALMRDGSFDVVHTHQSKAGLIGRVAARHAGISTVYHSASMASFGPGYSRSASLLFASAERVTAPLVSRYFVVGQDLADRIAGNGVSRRRLELVRSSLDLRAFRPAGPDAVAELRRGFEIDPADRVVCYVGSLDDRKGVTTLPDLVRAAAGAARVTLLVAGDGRRRPELEAQARRTDTGLTIRLLGHVRGVAEVMQASDALILPSSAEGLPQVLVQAACCGLPFVAYDVDGAAELLELGARGRVVPLGDRAALAAALAAELAGSAGGSTSTPAGSSAAAGSAGAAGPADGVEAVVDPRWASWDPAFVERQYLRRYEADLGKRLARAVAPADGGNGRRSRSVAVEPPVQPGPEAARRAGGWAV
jgi:glycosyltransferase involved in cell wall biosynthesis